jgi:hypothetical protein
MRDDGKDELAREGGRSGGAEVFAAPGRVDVGPDLYADSQAIVRCQSSLDILNEPCVPSRGRGNA